MRINPIIASSAQVVRTNKTRATEPTVTQPNKTDSVQFKSQPYCVERLKGLINLGSSLHFSPTKIGKVKNEENLRSLMYRLGEIMEIFPEHTKHPRFNDVVLPYLKNRWFNCVGEIAGRLGVKPGQGIELVGYEDVACGVMNLGDYDIFALNKPQSVLYFIDKEKDNYIAFSNARGDGVALTTPKERNEFYISCPGNGIQYKSHSTDGFEPMFYDKYYNEDGSENKFYKFLRKLK